MGSALESRFQRELIQELKRLFSGAIVMKLDSGYKQGIPDLLILHGQRWATLECKRDAHASHRPNQDWYVEKMNGMSFSRFIFPENRDEVLRDLIAYFAEQTTDERTEPA